MTVRRNIRFNKRESFGVEGVGCLERRWDCSAKDPCRSDGVQER